MRDSLFASAMPAPLVFPAYPLAPHTTLRRHARTASRMAQQRFDALLARLGMPESGNPGERKQANGAIVDG